MIGRAHLGLLARDIENSYRAAGAVDAGPVEQLRGRSITYRIAVGPQQGRKVFTLHTLPTCDPEDALQTIVQRWQVLGEGCLSLQFLVLCGVIPGPHMARRSCFMLRMKNFSPNAE